MWSPWNWARGLYYYCRCSWRIWRTRRAPTDDLIYTTKKDVRIEVYPGTKSSFDFIVKYREPGKRERTPQHVHLIVEMYVKHAHNPRLTLELKEHILRMVSQLKPVKAFPPKFQFFKPEHVASFKALDDVGEFTVEFLLVVSELIAIQEKTNYPKGSALERLYGGFGVKDRFSVIQAAVWRN